MLIHLAQNHDSSFSSDDLLEVQDTAAYAIVSEITA